MTLNPIGFPPPFRAARSRNSSSSPSGFASRAGWLMGFGDNKNLPDIVMAGDAVLHEPAREVGTDEIGSDRIQKIIDDMVRVMRKAPGVGLAAPQIGIPLKIIVLEDTKEYISYAPKEETKAQGRRPFDLLVVVNPKLKKKSDKTALFFEGCLRRETSHVSSPFVTSSVNNSQFYGSRPVKCHFSSSVDGYRAVVERYLEVEVTGFDRYGQPIKVDASGWQARILQHECDHLEGTVYVDRMVPKTFRMTENLDLPLPLGAPKLGPR